MPNFNTEEWKVGLFIEYIPVKEWEQQDCKKCGGSGNLGGHFKCLDDPYPCTECFGKGWKDYKVYPKTPKPELPQELVDHMRKAYLEYKLK